MVSPLNALMQDQVEKFMAYTNVCVMKASTDLTDSSSDLRQSAQIIFAHPEVFVQSQVMRDKTLQKRGSSYSNRRSSSNRRMVS